VIIMSGTGLFAKMITLPAVEIIQLRCLVAALTLLLFVKLTGASLAIARRTDLGWILLMGLIVAVHWIAFFTSIQLSSVAIGIISAFTFPAMTVLMEPWFFREPIDRRNLIIAMIVFGGVYLAIPGGLTGGKVALGAAWGILSAFLYAVRNILYRKHLSHYPSSAMMFYQVAVAAIVLLPFLSPDIDLVTDHRWLYIVVLGVIFTAVSHTLFIDSLRLIKASTAGMLTSLEPIYGIILAAVLISEMPEVKTVAGALIVVTAALYTSLRVHRDGK
jgi:drug/metabolite transporter (DMT)-like permease